MGEEADTHRAILYGNVDHIPLEVEKRSVKVFLCADPLDSEKERRALRINVYPKLREYCRHNHGLEFQVLDGYDGVHPNDFYSSKVRKVRMELLKECLRFSAGPCFVALVGEEYGQPCLPAQIECEEFDKIVNAAGDKRVCTKVLETWYLRDENGDPPVYQLIDSEELLPCSCSQRGSEVHTSKHDCFHQASRYIRTVFDIIVPMCVHDGILEAEQAEKYFISALEEELQCALRDRHPDLLERCICYIHKVPYKAFQKQKSTSEEWTKGSNHSYTKLCHIRDTFLPALAVQGNLRVYSATTTCNNKVGSSEEKQQLYLDGLCKQFYDDMITLIECSVTKSRVGKKEEDEEVKQHLSLCSMYSQLQWYENKEEDLIRHYIQQDKSRKVLVVTGEPCSGKTVLLASCSKKVHSWLRDSSAALVIRFLCSFSKPISLRSLLIGVCQQLSNVFQKKNCGNFDNVYTLQKNFVELLSASSKQIPIILILDAIDQVEYGGMLKTFWWLPSTLPKFTKIILSVTKHISVSCEIDKSFYKDQALFLEIKTTKKESIEALRLKLLAQKRRITSGQQIYVNRSLEHSTSKLMIFLIFKEVKEWKSHHDIEDQSLGKDIEDMIERLFHKLEHKYGYKLFCRALSYITLSRSGLAEAELVDLLSMDDVVLLQLYTLDHIVGSIRVPDWLVANILHDLNGCLSQRIIMGCKLVCWTNEQYKHVVLKKYLNSEEAIHKLHTNICHYFSGRWAYGRPKAIFVKNIHNPLKEELPSNLLTLDHGKPAKIYVDRQLPSQPWIFLHQRRFFGNIRKAYELPFHLKQCGKLDDLYSNVLMVLPYYKALLRCGQPEALIQNIEDAVCLTGRKEVIFICDILKESWCILTENPDTLEMVLQIRMMPLLHAYPGLLKLFKQVTYESITISSIVVQCSPLFEVPVAKLQYQEVSSVISILELKTKHLIIVFENGSVYSWNSGKQFTLKYQPSIATQIKAASVNNDGTCLALSTKNDSLILLDTLSWTVLNEIKENASRNLQETELIIKSFHLMNSSLFVSFNNSSVVRIFDVLSGAVTNEFSFPQQVTFFACENDGKYTILGQTKQIILCNNEHFSHQISLSMDLSKYTISGIYIYNSVVYIIDNTGNITVWDITNPTKPQLLDELYTSEECNDVICTEFSLEWLLICRLQYIELWKLKNWESSIFRAPNGSTFISCVFTNRYKEIIAAVENMPMLFVWNRDSGQCISTLSLHGGQLTLLTKCNQQNSLVAVTRDKCLMAWDLNLTIHTSHFQTGRLISSLLLCPEGRNIYTADNSDIICKWDFFTSRITAFFLHGASVEIMKLAANGELLVASVTSGDLYVWATDTGENILYIQNDPVSQLLVTPNGHFVVNLSMDGVSRVWNPHTGCTVCSIHVHLQEAVITPESTFVVGLHNHGLLAVNLWSGGVSKEFTCTDKTSSVLAFRCLMVHPDVIVLITSSSELYTWNIVEETICHHVKLQTHFSHPCDWLHVSSNGNIIITTAGNTINVLNSKSKTLGVLHAPNTILYQHLTKDGHFLLYVCINNPCDCRCRFHSNPVLYLINVFNGENIGQCNLGKMPSTMKVSEDDITICLGFEDGTLGIYSLMEICVDSNRRLDLFSFLKHPKCDNNSITIYNSKCYPNVSWVDAKSNNYKSDS